MNDKKWKYGKSVYSRGRQWSLSVSGYYAAHVMGCIEKADEDWIKSAEDYEERFFSFAGIHINNQDDADLISCLCENEKHQFETWCIFLFEASKYLKAYRLKGFFDYFVDGKTPIEAVSELEPQYAR